MTRELTRYQTCFPIEDLKVCLKLPKYLDNLADFASPPQLNLLWTKDFISLRRSFNVALTLADIGDSTHYRVSKVQPPEISRVHQISIEFYTSREASA